MISMAMIQAERRAIHGGKYAWVITRDRSFELDQRSDEPLSDKSEEGTAGPADATDEQIELARTRGLPFRLVDEGDVDDLTDYGVSAEHPEYGVVYEGRIWIADDADGDVDFMPLNDFGIPMAMAIGIQYQDDTGNWRDL